MKNILFLSFQKKHCEKIIRCTFTFLITLFGIMWCITLFSLQKTVYYEKMSDIPNDLLPETLTESFPSEGKIKMNHHTWNSYFEFTGQLRQNVDFNMWYQNIKNHNEFELFFEDMSLNSEKNFEYSFPVKFEKDNQKWQIDYYLTNMRSFTRKGRSTSERYENNEIHFRISYTKPGVEHGR